MASQITVVFGLGYLASLNAKMLAALRTLVEMEDRDNKTDPDVAFTDEGRAAAWKAARDAIAQAEAHHDN